METLEKIACKFLIWRFKRGYGGNCEDYEECCTSCKAKRVMEFMQEHVELLDFYS